MCLKNLWNHLQAYHQSGNLVPTYILIAFASPILTHHIRMEQGIATRVIGRCLEALVVKELVSGLKPSTNANVQIRNDKLAWLSAILCTKTDDTEFCLACPGAIEFVTMASIILGDIGSLAINVLPSDVQDVVQRTVAILSQTARPHLDHPISQLGILDAELDHVNVSNLHKFLQMCNKPGTLTAQVRRSCLRMCLKSLWYCAKAYHQLGTSKPLSSYFPSTLASEEITMRIRTEQDPVSRVVGCCFSALVVMRLVADIRLRTETKFQISNNEKSFLLAVVRRETHSITEPLVVIKQPSVIKQLGVIELLNVLALAFDDINSLSTDTMPSYVQHMAQDVVSQTFSILSHALPAEINTETRDQIDAQPDIPSGQCKLVLHPVTIV
jgi:hypothetical protein